MKTEINITQDWPMTAPYVAVLPFKGEDILLSQIFSRGWEFPAAQRQSSETYEEAAHRLLMDQCGTQPLILGKLAVEDLLIERPADGLTDGSADELDPVQVVYFWAVVDDVSPSQSMDVGEPKFFNSKQIAAVPMVQQKKVLYDEAINYAKIVAEQLAKVSA